MKFSLHLHFPKIPFSTFISNKFEHNLLICFFATLISSCNLEDPQIPTEPPGEVINATNCDSSSLLSTSSHFAAFQPIATDASSLISKFSKYIDIEGRDVTKFQREDGLRIYESTPGIVIEIYKGSWRTLQKELSINSKKNGYIGFAKRGVKYYWEAKAFIKDPVTLTYSLDPSKFKVFLSHEFVMPEWHAVGDVTAAEKGKWDKYYCRLALHERTHAEITREHILGTIAETLNLKTQTSDELKKAIRKTWKYRRAELKVRQNFFDSETKRKRRRKIKS